MSISVIIPVGHKDDNFSLIDQIKSKFKDFEIIIAASYQNSIVKEQKDNVDQLLSIHNSTRAKALNAGAQIAKHDLLWFLHLDSDISLLEEIDFSKVDDEKINTFLLKFKDDKLKYNAKGANLRTAYLGLPFGDQSFIIHKKIFNLIGSYSESLAKGEDHDLIWKAKKIGIKVNLIKRFITSSPIKYEAHPIIQTLNTIKDTLAQIFQFRKSRANFAVCHFIKDPQSTKSKTRLRKDLSNELVNEINENLMEIVSNNIKEIKSNNSIHQIIVTEKDSKDYAVDFSKLADGLYISSQKELGLTMREVIEFNLKYFQKVVIVGSDIPFLTAKDITDSLKIKSAKNVFYPTLDGGFCLLATSDKNILDVIHTIKYGTDTVLADLTKKVSKLLIHNKFYQDIDVKEDLTAVYKSLKEKVYSLNVLQKKLYTLLYSKQKEFTE